MATKMRVWEPMRDVVTLREAMDRLFEESFAPAWRAGEARSNGLFRPAADAWEDADAVVIELALPGVEPGTVDVTYEQESLTIRGALAERDAEKTWVLNERVRGPFERRFTLHTPVDVDRAEATFHNGVLTLHLPKSEATKPRKIDVRMN